MAKTRKTPKARLLWSLPLKYFEDMRERGLTHTKIAKTIFYDSKIDKSSLQGERITAKDISNHLRARAQEGSPAAPVSTKAKIAKAEAAAKKPAKARRKPRKVMNMDDVETLGCIRLDGQDFPKIQGFTIHDGALFMFLDNGVSVRFHGEFELVDKGSTQILRQTLRREWEALAAVANLAGLDRRE